MAAYSVALNNGGAAAVLQAFEPNPVNAEEDSGSMAMFMDDVGQKAETIDGSAPEEPVAENGADFAA